MTGVTRRALLGGAAGVAGIAVMPSALAKQEPALHVFDSRLGLLKPRARVHHDVANEDASLWRASRDLAVKPGDQVTGVTRWTDWIAMRGLFNERGLRTRRVTVAGNIATWEMG